MEEVAPSVRRTFHSLTASRRVTLGQPREFRAGLMCWYFFTPYTTRAEKLISFSFFFAFCSCLRLPHPVRTNSMRRRETHMFGLRFCLLRTFLVKKGLNLYKENIVLWHFLTTSEICPSQGRVASTMTPRILIDRHVTSSVEPAQKSAQLMSRLNILPFC